MELAPALHLLASLYRTTQTHLISPVCCCSCFFLCSSMLCLTVSKYARHENFLKILRTLCLTRCSMKDCSASSGRYTQLSGEARKSWGAVESP